MATKRLGMQSRAALTAAAERTRAAFVLLLGGLLEAVRRIFLPHLLVSLGLFTLAGYALYRSLLGPLDLPAFLYWPAAVLAVGFYGIVAFLYAAAVSVVYGIWKAAAGVEDFLYALFETLKQKVSEKVENMDEGIARRQAKVILEHSVREVFAPLKAVRLRSAPAAVAAVLLGALTFVTRSVFVARLAHLSGAGVSLSAVFASRATLVGALFLNLRWLAAAALGLLYAVGAGVLLLNLWMVW